MSTEPRLVEVRRNVLKQNDVIAGELRRRFRAAGVYTVSLVSSPARARRPSSKRRSRFSAGAIE